MSLTGSAVLREIEDARKSNAKEKELLHSFNLDRSMIGGLTHDEIIIACRNMGINLECGGCAENFYTGHNDPEHHNENCTCTRKARAMLYTIVTEQDRLSFTEAINHNLAQGWKLCGGPFITTYACGHGNIRS